MLLSLRAAGDYVVEVLAVPFGSPKNLDAYGTYFDARTPLHLDKFTPLVVYYHGYKPDGQPQGVPEIIGEALRHWVDAAGVWFKVQLNKANQYAQRVWQAVQENKAVASHATLEHLMRFAPDGHADFWPLAEITLFDKGDGRVPANRYTVVQAAHRRLCLRANRPQLALTAPAQATRQSGKSPAARSPLPPLRVGETTMDKYGIFKIEEGPDAGKFAIYALDADGNPTGDPVAVGELATWATQPEAEAALAEMMTPARTQPKLTRVEPTPTRAAAPVDGKLTHAEQQKIIELVMQRIEQAPATRSFGVATQRPEPSKDEKALKQMRAFGEFLRGDGGKALRALQMDLDSAGGATVAPVQFVNDLLKAVDNAVYIRQWMQEAGVLFPVAKSTSLGVPVLTTDASDADWTPEIKAVADNDAMAFGWRSLTPHQLAKLVKVSNKLQRASSIDIVGLVRQRMAYKVGVTCEKGYLTGNGNLQPLGVFIASSQGISTGRDTTCASQTTFTADELIDLKHSIKPQYWPRLKWIFSRNFLKIARKLKDGQGQYLWAAGIAGGMPNTILDCPYYVSEYAPSTFTNGLYVAVLGDFSFYWGADALDMEVQVLDQLYAATNQTGYIARMETDGMPVLEEAFARLKLA